MNIRDKRTITEQIKSGFRIGGWVLLTVLFIILLLGSTSSIVGKGNYTQPLHRIIAACVLAALTGIMFVTVRHWVKWFIGALGYFDIKAVISLALGATPSVPSIARPRVIIAEFLILLVLATALCLRYLTHAPKKLEAAALVVLVVSLCCSVIYDSGTPLLAGTAMLAIVQLTRTRYARPT